MEKKILILGACPPPFTGQSISLDKLKRSLINDSSFQVKHINFAPKNQHTTGKMNLLRAFETVSVILKYLIALIIFRPDIIYLTKGSSKWGFVRDYSFLVLRNLFCPKAKFIVHLKGGNYDVFYHDSSPKLKKYILRFVKNCDKIIVLGPSLISMYEFCPEVIGKIHVLYNALPQDNEVKPKINNNNTLQVLFLSNLLLSKGYFDVLHASSKLKDLNIHFHFAGEFMLSPDDEISEFDVNKRKADFENYIKNNGLIDKVTYHGVLVGDEKNKLLEWADVFILPTYYHVEGQPISIIEAMSFSNAIIATKYRSIPDIIEEGVNSIFVNSRDPESLVSAISELYYNRDELRSFQIGSYNRYLKFHTWDNHYKAMKNILKEE